MRPIPQGLVPPVSNVITARSASVFLPLSWSLLPGSLPSSVSHVPPFFYLCFSLSLPLSPPPLPQFPYLCRSQKSLPYASISLLLLFFRPSRLALHPTARLRIHFLFYCVETASGYLSPPFPLPSPHAQASGNRSYTRQTSGRTSRPGSKPERYRSGQAAPWLPEAPGRDELTASWLGFHQLPLPELPPRWS